MAQLQAILDVLAAEPVCGYRTGGAAFAEPTALAALALIRHGRRHEARPALKWLSRRQDPAGGLGVSQSQATPCWSTGLAVLAWWAADGGGESPAWQPQIQSGLRWILHSAGESLPRTEVAGHDPSLVGWS